MHTFFINTSQTVSSADYRELLFEELLSRRQLLIPRDYVPFEDLGRCAEEIASLINQETDVTEEIRLIVFIEPSCSPTDHLGEDRARALAEEKLLCIKAEGALVWKLHEMGKQPGELVFVLGEKVSRDAAMHGETDYQQAIFRQYWNLIELPALDTVAARLNDSDHPISQGELFDLLRSREKPGAIISRADPCYDPLIKTLADSLLTRQKIRRNDVTLDDLLSDVNNALTEYENNTLRSHILGRHAASVMYTCQHMELSDPQERNRTACRLMLYVYAWACERPELLENLTRSLAPNDAQGNVAGNGRQPLTALPMPAVRYDRLTGALARKVEELRRVSYDAQADPPELHDKVRPEKTQPGNLIHSAYEKLPELQVTVRPHKGLTLRGLRRAVGETLSEVEEKNKNNHQQIVRYLNRTSAEYDRIKDDALRGVPFLQKATGQNAMDDLKNNADDIAARREEAECRILDALGRVTTPEDVQAAVDAVRAQCEYWFGCLRRGAVLFGACGAFLLCFLLPYLYIRLDIISQQGGFLYFIATAAIVAGALALGNLWFSRKYTRRVTALVKKLCREFNSSQEANLGCLRSYADFMYRKVPLCYALARFDRTLSEFREKSRLYQEKTSYHESSVRRRRRLIERLLDNIDRGWKRESDATSCRINPEISRVEGKNRDIYLLTTEEIEQAMQWGREQPA